MQTSTGKYFHLNIDNISCTVKQVIIRYMKLSLDSLVEASAKVSCSESFGIKNIKMTIFVLHYKTFKKLAVLAINRI